MAEETTKPSARQVELLDAAYAYVLKNGLADLSLRPLSAAIGTSPRVLLFLFGNKDGLIQALLARAREDELGLLQQLERTTNTPSLAATTELVWSWLRDPAHRPLLRLWAETYTRSLVEPAGPWAGFAADTVHDWLRLLEVGGVSEQRSDADLSRRTLVLAVLRGCLLDLLATGDEKRVDEAVRQHLAALDDSE